MLRAAMLWWAPRVRVGMAGIVQFMRDWILPGFARMIATLMRSVSWRIRVSFARRGLLGKGLYLTVGLYGLALLSADAGARGLARSFGQAATSLVSVIAAAALIRLIWLKFTDEHTGLRP